MAQRRTQKPSGLSYGTSGEAKLVKVDANRARIEFANGTIVNLNVVQGDIFAEDKKATLPEYVPFKSMKDGGFLNVRVSMEKGDTRVLFINPLSGTYTVKFIGFAANPPEGFVPVWTEKQGDGGKNTYRECNPFVELVAKGERWQGCKVRGKIYDYFGKDEEDGNATIYEAKRGTGWKNCEDFCNCIGFEYWNTPFTENMLPEMQRIALENNNEFQIVFSNGYISTWLPPVPDDNFVDEVDETFPPAEKTDAEKMLEE